MPTLQFGTLDVAYSQASLRKAGINPGAFKSSSVTTGDVAEILESQYHVMQTFYILKQERIAGFLANSMANALQDRLNGRTVGRNPMFDAEQQIEAAFRGFLDANEMNRLSVALTGTPVSAAAVAGVNPRKKHPYAKKNKARPSFIATGLYRASFRALYKP
jgi:hypothetical protein